MTHDELLEAIERTMHEIGRIKQQIEEAANPREERRLARKKRELQYLQLWHHDLLERLELKPEGIDIILDMPDCRHNII